MHSTPLEIEFVRFDPRDFQQMEVIVSIHKAVLPESFVVRMGNYFMKRFYYTVLPKMGFLNCLLLQYKGTYAGIIVTNIKPFSLIRSSIPSNFFTFCWVMCVSLLQLAQRFAVLFEVLKYKPDPILRSFEQTGTAFEILTIGVLSSFRQVILPDGRKLSHALLHEAVSYYRAKGFTHVTGQILKSNQEALKFYSKYNATFLQSSTREFGVIMDLPLSNFDTPR